MEDPKVDELIATFFHSTQCLRVLRIVPCNFNSQKAILHWQNLQSNLYVEFLIFWRSDLQSLVGKFEQVFSYQVLAEISTSQ